MQTGSSVSKEEGTGDMLKQRHISMIALGGVTGAGLFVGSGVVVKSADPAVGLSFLLIGGLLIRMRQQEVLLAGHGSGRG